MQTSLLRGRGARHRSVIDEAGLQAYTGHIFKLVTGSLFRLDLLLFARRVLAGQGQLKE